jgi:hypothetical protein
MQKLKPELFDNKFYTVKKVNNDIVIVQFVDYQYSNPNAANGINIFTKTIKLKRLDIPIDKFMQMDETKEAYLFYNTIKNEINKEFIKIITELGDKHRVDSPMDRLDIDISKLKKTYPDDSKDKIGRRILSKCISSSSYIATDGRIGPAQWILSNNKTYKFVLDYLSDSLLTYDDTSNLLVGGMQYIINDEIDDDIILVGRQNKIDQPGVLCTILTDENGYIYTQEVAGFNNYQRTVSVFYSVDEIGFNSIRQFLKLNTRSLGYYRAKKLQRIKELYGE